MIRQTVVLLAVLAPIGLCACASFPTGDIQFEAESDPKVRFEGYGSYAWLAEAAVLNDPDGVWEPPSFDVDAEVRFLIDRELRARHE